MMVYIKHYNRIDRQMTEFLFLMLKHKKRKKELHTLYNIYIYTVALIGINLYSVLSLYLFIQFL